MARVIEFQVPANFQSRKHWTSPEHRGKLLQFPARFRREVPSAENAGRLEKLAAVLGDLPLLRQLPML